MRTCDTFWGSHGCVLPEGHDPEQEHPIHECSAAYRDRTGVVLDKGDVCSQVQYVNDTTSRVRYNMSNDEWSSWLENPAGLFRMDEEKAR